jgi:hypothetical protein
MYLAAWGNNNLPRLFFLCIFVFCVGLVFFLSFLFFLYDGVLSRGQGVGARAEAGHAAGAGAGRRRRRRLRNRAVERGGSQLDVVLVGGQRGGDLAQLRCAAGQAAVHGRRVWRRAVIDERLGRPCQPPGHLLAEGKGLQLEPLHGVLAEESKAVRIANWACGLLGGSLLLLLLLMLLLLLRRRLQWLLREGVLEVGDVYE